MSFPNKNKRKTDVRCHPNFGQREIFTLDHLKQHEKAFFTFLYYQKTSDLLLILEDFY